VTLKGEEIRGTEKTGRGEGGVSRIKTQGIKRGRSALKREGKLTCLGFVRETSRKRKSGGGGGGGRGERRERGPPSKKEPW